MYLFKNSELKMQNSFFWHGCQAVEWVIYQEIFWTKLHDISFGILADKDNYFDSQTSIIEVTNCKQ